MKKNLLLFLKYFFLNGCLFAGIMALFQYWDENSFSWVQFLFNFTIYGFAMGLFWYAGVKARDRVKNNN